jgi:propanediol dehydratase large subunit
MKKSQQITRFNRAAFRVGAETVRGGRLEQLLEEALSQVFGGDGTTCTAFTCSVYAPPPPSPG